jgi:hypothetical protein
LEKEEQERQELRKMIMGEGGDQDQRKGKDKKKDDDDNQSLTGYSSQPGEEPCVCVKVKLGFFKSEHRLTLQITESALVLSDVTHYYYLPVI